MNRFSLPIFLLFFFLFVFKSTADPGFVTDDWNLLDNTIQIKTELRFSNPNYDIKLKVTNNELVLSSSDNSKTIFKFNKNKFDIYLISKNNEPVIYIFDKTDKKLFIGNVKDINVEFEPKSWNFGTLMAVLKDCNPTESDPFGMVHDKNYMLSKFKYDERPKEYQCRYLFYGGRCELVFDSNTNEYGSDKMIISDDFLYVGDISEVARLVMNSRTEDEIGYGTNCTFYNKISIGL